MVLNFILSNIKLRQSVTGRKMVFFHCYLFYILLLEDSHISLVNRKSRTHTRTQARTYTLTRNPKLSTICLVFMESCDTYFVFKMLEKLNGAK